ncbi:MAG: BrnT family toxin [Defluviitaleaceae bacterium]|nr:BrnT family toxin [Defluviitaleaceae bacterium]
MFEIDGQLYDWDDDKKITNLKKHGISFEHATTVFKDDLSVLLFDYDHSDFEDRYKIIGYCEKSQILVVCHCYYEDGEIIRIISARKATADEKAIYEERGDYHGFG